MESRIKRARRKFTDDFKNEAVERVRNGDSASVRKVAAEIGVHQNVLRKWMANAGVLPPLWRPYPPGEGNRVEAIVEPATTLESLQIENARLRAVLRVALGL